MNAGGLALCEGVLFWGQDLGRGLVRRYDLDGRPLDSEIELNLGPKSSVSGLVVDDDRRLWIADTARRALRGFNLFGFEGSDFAPATGRLDRPVGGMLDGPVDVALPPGSSYSGLWVATGGVRRQAVGLYLPDGTRLEALRSAGDPQRSFDRVRRLSSAGALLCVLEEAAVQVFRGVDFHFSFRPKGGHLRSVVQLLDGRTVVAFGKRESECIAIFDSSGIQRSVVANAASEHDVEDTGGGSVSGVVDMAVEDTGEERSARLFVLDQEGARVQVFGLGGRCFGAFGPGLD